MSNTYFLLTVFAWEGYIHSLATLLGIPVHEFYFYKVRISLFLLKLSEGDNCTIYLLLR